MSIVELSKLAAEATAKAASEAMKIMGYNVIALDGWIVKIFPDGRIEKIKEISKSDSPIKFD